MKIKNENIKKAYRTIKENISYQEDYFRDKSCKYNKKINEMSELSQKMSLNLKLFQKKRY
tara:strand:- start:524 stop:703 length:180 start_codon:yes stop_codon:yes gene_type:complete